MTGSRVLALVALGAIASAAPARAQNFCYASRLWTCFSYQITATANGSGGTNVSLMIRNTSVADPTGQASWLTAIGIYAPSNVGTGSNLSVTTSGTVQKVGSAGGQWGISTPPPTLGLPGSIDLLATGTNPKQGDVMGCGTTGGATIYFRTCAPSYPGWVVFNFKTTGNWASEVSQLDLAVKWQTSQGSFECTSGAPGKSTIACNGPPVTATPEPITLTLLGTGLASMGGFGLIRRRRRNHTDV